MPAYSSAVAESTLVGTSATAICTVPSGKCRRITSIILTNYSLSGTPTSNKVSLYVGGSTDQYKIRDSITLNPGDSYVFSDPLVLPASTVINAKADASSKITAFVNSVEMFTP